MHTAERDRLMDIVGPRDQARLLEQQTGLGACFMKITPSTTIRSNLSSDQYRLGLKWWLGCKIIHEDDQNPAVCPGCLSHVDPWGDHLLCCPRDNFSSRHRALQDSLANIIQETGQGYAKEVVIPHCPDHQLRPADILVRSWDSGKDLAIDLTICHGWQASERSGSITRERWRSFLTRKEQGKAIKYAKPCEAAGWIFQGMAFGTWGGMGPGAARLLAKLLKRGASWDEGERRAARQEELRETLGLTLMSHIIDLLEAKNLLQ